jgi:Holliday junction resolvase RusA-like endonuclease
MQIEFQIPMEGQPVQTGGKRIYVGKKGKMKGKPIFFKDSRTIRYLEAISFFSSRHRPLAPISGPVKIQVLFVMSRPKRLMRKKDPEGRIWMDLRPDYDNLQKGTQDALEGFWLDDGQIASATIEKVFSAKNEKASIYLSIYSLESLPPPHWGLPA